MQRPSGAGIAEATEFSCGVACVSKGHVLIVEMANGCFGFPKGHVEPTDEDDVDTALREFTEETGVSLERSAIQLDARPFVQQYRNPDRDALKKVTLFAARRDTMPEPTPQPGEIRACRWVAVSAAPELLTWTEDRNALRDILAALDASKA